MGQPILDSFSEITQALKDCMVRNEQANIYLERCINDLLQLEVATDREK